MQSGRPVSQRTNHLQNKERPQISASHFNVIASLTYSLPFNTIKLREKIQNEFKEYIKLEGNENTLFYCLGIVLCQELLSSKQNDEIVIKLREAIENVKKISSRLHFQNSSLNDLDKQIFRFIKWLAETSKVQLATTLLGMRSTIGKIVIEEGRKNPEVINCLVLAIRCVLINYLSDENMSNSNKLLNIVCFNFKRIDFENEKELIKIFCKYFNIRLNLVIASDNHYADIKYGPGNEIPQAFLLNVASVTRSFQGILYPKPEYIQTLYDQISQNPQTGGFRESESIVTNGILRRSINETRDSIRERGSFKEKESDRGRVLFTEPDRISYSSIKPTERSNSRSRVIMTEPDDLSSPFKELLDYSESQQEDSHLICALCRSQIPETPAISNPSCRHNYCLYCLVDMKGATNERCPVGGCRKRLNQDQVSRFLNFQKLTPLRLIKNEPDLVNRNHFIRVNVEKLTCPITGECYDSKTNIPKLLPCGHTISQKALQNLLRSPDSLEFQCPLDKKKWPKQSLAEFCTNFALLKIIKDVDNKRGYVDYMKDKIESCLQQIDSWIVDCNKLVSAQKIAFIQEIEDKFNSIIKAIEQKKNSIINELQNTLITQPVNQKDQEILQELRDKFESELLEAEKLKKEGYEITEPGKEYFEMAIHRIEEAFEKARCAPDIQVKYKLKSDAFDSILRQLSKCNPKITENGNEKIVEI